MSRRRKPEARCPTCRMRQELCLCSEIAAFRALKLSSPRVTVLMHHREAQLTTNTAHLAALLLPRCEIHVRGEVGRTLDASAILNPNESPLLLYPSEQARPLTAALVSELDKPVCLIVPDGSWRQASKVAKRESFLAHVPHVTLNADAPTRYLLRREPKADGLATFEAIARALGVIEGPRLRLEMEKVFTLMVDRTLRSREGRQPIDD